MVNVVLGFFNCLCAATMNSFHIGEARLRDSAFGESAVASAFPIQIPVTMFGVKPMVTGIWMGNADATALSPKAESLNLASPIWKEFMVAAHKQLKKS